MERYPVCAFHPEGIGEIVDNVCFSVTLAFIKIIPSTMKTKPNRTIVLCLVLLFNGLLYGQDSTSVSSVFDYLTQEEGAELLLELNLTDLMNNRKKTDYIPAQLSDKGGKVFPLEVRTRGKFRRARCEIPPIKLKFSKDSLLAGQMNKMNEIKLVLPCLDRSDSEELIIREYIAYRMYETLSPGSCARARLIQLKLKDHKKKRPKKMFAMLVEHEEEVSKRLHCSVVEEWGIKPEHLQADQAALMVLFQFMIGNTDWEIVSCRNIMLLQPADSTSKIIPIPYDFDFSGLVSAPYASPSSESGLATVRDRFLMAQGMEKTALEHARETLIKAKPSLYAWCDNPFLSKASSTDITGFLDAFFTALENETEIPAKLELSKE